MSTAEKKKITLSLRTETGWITKDLETQSQAESSGAELIKSKKPPRVQKKKSAKKSNDWNIDKDDRFDLPILKNYHDDKLELPLKPGFRKPQPKVKRENNNQKDDKKINAILSHSIDTTVSTTSFESNTMISTSSLDSTRNEIFNAALNLDDNNPSFTFYSNRLNSQLVRTLVNDLKFVKMTSVQAKTIDPLLSNYDMHVQAKTGTGKTVSFLVPAIQKIIDKYRNGRRGISLLVISPTRELAMQIATEAKQIAASFTNIKVGISIGGTNLNTEKNIILSGLDILVATPGRLLDHLSDDNIAGLLYYLDTFVLDECDRLLDMGFSPDIYKIMKFLPIEKQSILCSATVTPRVKDIAVKLLKKDHHFVSTVPIGDVDTHKKVPQFCIEAPFTEQLLQCITVLQNETNEKFKAIVFLPTAHLANLYYCVYSESYPSNVFVQHSRQSQSKRQNVSDKFKDCTFGIMFATDVVARGMDYPNVTHVIQIGLPDSRETYVHRIGRTGRAEQNGKGFIILAPQEISFLNRLQGVPISKISQSISSTAQAVQTKGVKTYKLDPKNAMRAYQSFLGYYKSEVRTLGFTVEQLVHTANIFADVVLDCDPAPGLEARVIGKMGLKGVKGLIKLPNESRK